MSDYNECMRKGYVSWGASFNKRDETNQVLGLDDRAGYRKGGAEFSLADGTRALIWWPKDEDEDHRWINKKEVLGPRTDSQGYSEVLTISERNKDEKLNDKRLQEEKALIPLRNRYVFWHETSRRVSFYKFLGVFQFDAKQSDEKGCCIYNRIADQIPVKIV